jgi:hypothetical protein
MRPGFVAKRTLATLAPDLSNHRLRACGPRANAHRQASAPKPYLALGVFGIAKHRDGARDGAD